MSFLKTGITDQIYTMLKPQMLNKNCLEAESSVKVRGAGLESLNCIKVT
jgi:hypothetical protein